MTLKTPIVAALGLLAIGYATYPFVTLYRIETAVRRGDTKTLRSLVDWPKVRAGIEADLAQQHRSDELPPFGAAFIRKVAVSNSVSPTGVCAALRDMPATKGDGDAIRTGWLEGPGTLMLELGQVRLRIALEGGVWQVTRVWLPKAVLTAAADAGSDG